MSEKKEKVTTESLIQELKEDLHSALREVSSFSCDAGNGGYLRFLLDGIIQLTNMNQ